MDDLTPQLITVADAADRLGLSRSKCYELMACGDLPSVLIGRNRRIDLRDLAAFIDAHRTTNTRPASERARAAVKSLRR